jgi:hypothetical protein
VSKYDRLREELDRRAAGPVTLSFTAVEKVVALPPSARTYTAWWSNDRGGTHVQAAAWLDADREVAAVDLNAETVTFSARRGG